MLTNTKSATNPNETYTWDAVGNRLTSTGSRPVFDTAISGPTPTDYSYSDGYRLSSDTVYTYTYDAEGNTVSKAYKNGYATWTYSYDGEDRMTAASRYYLIYSVFLREYNKHIDSYEKGDKSTVS